MKFFTKIALLSAFLAISIIPAFAEENSPTTTSTPTNNSINKAFGKLKIRATSKSIDIVCIQNATDKRDSTVITAIDTYYLGIKTALTTRKESLKSAWASITERKQLLKQAWEQFRLTHKELTKQLRINKKSAWDQFYTDRKNCKGNYNDEPSGGQGIDAQL
jgi:hypothetical protein